MWSTTLIWRRRDDKSLTQCRTKNSHAAVITDSEFEILSASLINEIFSSRTRIFSTTNIEFVTGQNTELIPSILYLRIPPKAKL